MAKKHLTFDCPVCKEPDEVVGRVTGHSTSGETGRWICFACRAEGEWVLTLTPDAVEGDG
jgi:hypothetical protein